MSSYDKYLSVYSELVENITLLKHKPKLSKKEKAELTLLEEKFALLELGWKAGFFRSLNEQRKL